ncbi:MAG: YggS family pyridoxal phosphate-dependent enzyme [Chloroflexi bacterium HGW-Chloroflexi-3]|nr:MAG: YggS family pyridoxal phosphate-dependent enzyme [Chloroflexi bacterium HGW-Chloroflexi-3]
MDLTIDRNFKKVMDDIDSYCNLFNRERESVKLIVVTKSQPSEKIDQVIAAGARYLGENYPEETSEKKSNLINLPEDLEWHMIGHLQSRKSQLVINEFTMMHSLDSVKLAKRLDRQLKAEDKKFPVLLQFNVGGEDSKFGWNASDKKNWSSVISEVAEVVNCSNLVIEGLMTMPPFTSNEAESRIYFKKLRELGQYLQSEFPELYIKEYSMGTSHDFKMAIAEGATMIRIGTAIMGSREK